MITTSTTTSRAGITALAALLLALTSCGSPQIEEPREAEPSTEQEAADEDPAPDDVGDADERDTTDDSQSTPATPVADQPASYPPTPSDPPPANPKNAIPVALVDGTHAGRLVSIDTANVALELVRVLSGDAAVAAAKADGIPLEGGGLPNDVYVQDLGQTVSVPVAGDGGFQVYDCSTGCELVGTTLDALASGKATPYGGPNAVVEVRVDAGAVVSLVEVYLP